MAPTSAAVASSATETMNAPSANLPLKGAPDNIPSGAQLDGDALAGSESGETDTELETSTKAFDNDKPLFFDRNMKGSRKRRHDIFMAWYKDLRTQKNVANVVQKRREAKSGMAEELMSTKALISNTTQVISQPREYQLELFEMAKRENILAVLGTGSGKTLIACLLIRHMVNEELEARTRGELRRVSLFLADSVALCFQQTAVLECNIDAKVGKFHGSNTVDMERVAWNRVLDDHQVLVMTADVLYNCLTHGMIAMRDINLLCFDEAHHAKKSHVYARIIRDFYICEPESQRPKVFGMTASPVDSRVDVEYAARELERLMHCRIATTSDLTLLQNSLNKPRERILHYTVNSSLGKIGAPLFCRLKQRYEGIKSFRKLFAFSTWARVELGPWFADFVWSFALSELETQKIERKLEKVSAKQMTTEELAAMDKEIELIREAQQIVAEHEIPHPVFSQASPKVQQLAGYLTKTFSKPTGERCLVFVTRRNTARCLKGFFDRLSPPHMRHDILIGSGETGGGGDKFTFRQQMLSVIRFKHGSLNCLFATSVAEEGLDIPDCNLVIRFDLYSNMIQYIQSRGRARHVNSHYIHMVESTNQDHYLAVRESKDAETVMKEFCEKLPEDRLLDKHDVEERDQIESSYTYIEPSTGAKMTMNSAMKIIAHYCDNLPCESEGVNHPTYILRSLGPKEYVCELLLPANSPLTHFEGQPMPSKPMAKRAVAYDACVQLRRAGCLNEHLLPLYLGKSIPSMANAKLAVDVNKKNTYAYCPKPTFWNIKDKIRPVRLWLTLLMLERPEKITNGRPFHHIALLSREKLPNMPSFTVYGDSGYDSVVNLICLDEPIKITDDDVMGLFGTFSERVFNDVFNKKFEWEFGTTPYWLTPLTTGKHRHDTSPQDCIDWDTLRLIASSDDMKWDITTPLENFREKFLVDHVQRSRRFAIHGWDAMLQPDDPVPAGAASAPGITSIKDYSYNAGHKGKKYRWVTWEIPSTEPVLIASRVLHRLNYLEPPAERDMVANTSAYVCPSAFKVSMISMALVRSIMVLPAISWRIDAYLQAWDVCKITGIDIDLGLALEAITKDSENSHEHNSEEINKQHGMGANYERLEFLGDCYLKLGTTISLFTHEPGDDEYHLHVARMQLVCNANLFKNAKLMGLPQHIQTQGFSRRTWYPHMKLLHGKGVGKDVGTHNPNHKLGDKSIADVCEALIGAALIDKGLDGAAQMTTAVLCGEIHTPMTWKDYYQAYVAPEYQGWEPTASQNKLACEIEAQFGYKFKSPRLLMSAFTHPSNPFSYEKVPNYQRLEFLGDALFDLTCVQFIFDNNPRADPQWMTEHKMAMVSNKFLSAVCVELGLHRRLRACSPQIGVRNTEYALELEELKKETPTADYWVGVQTKPPKELADILEAFIGAMFVDSEFDFNVVQMFFDNHIKRYFIDMSLYDDFAGQHPTTFLTKELTRRGCMNWGYEKRQFNEGENSFVLSAIVIHAEVFEFALGDSVKAAKAIASTKALEKLEQMKDSEFEKVCNCRNIEAAILEGHETSKIAKGGDSKA